MQFSSSVVVHVEAVVVVVDGEVVVADVKSFGETEESGVPITA
jgi:hypothetical protein